MTITGTSMLDTSEPSQSSGRPSVPLKIAAATPAVEKTRERCSMEQPALHSPPSRTRPFHARISSLHEQSPSSGGLTRPPLTLAGRVPKRA